MLAYLKKIPTLLSVYNALQISQELRESLIQAFSDPQKYQEEMGPLDLVACLVSVSFSDEEKYDKMKDRNRESLGNKPITCVMVDNGLASNIVSLRTLLSVE